MSKVKLKYQAGSPIACPKRENLADTSPGRSGAVLPSARENCPAGCKPQLAGAYCPPLCACSQQIHMLSWLNPYLLPSGRTEKQQVSYYRQYSSLYTGSESKKLKSTICEAQMNVHTPLHSSTTTKESQQQLLTGVQQSAWCSSAQRTN